ncbi:MAG: DUF1015 domain-containing protein [Treponema sp.]|jgi:hypothetical protein|nr:DUF1015 domain-containing protein [Treponema sp.]
MSNIAERLEKLGIAIPEILLPQGVDLRQWAVIACDQFTQDRTFWKKVKEAAGASPSTLNLTFPEVFLADDDRVQRIENIHRSMRHYLDSGVFAAARRGFVYLERDTPFNCGRKGLVTAVDLEQYSWLPGARPLIRPTEGTVPERLPPRMDIRRNAPLETPHILLLIDDDTDSLLQELGERAKKNAPAYQGELMLNSGSISGWFLDAEDDWAFLAGGLEELSRRALTRYSAGDAAAQTGSPFLFAVGDGNHSLASARGIWEEYKAENGKSSPVSSNHIRCRHALVEIENIYDPAIQFEPIHRVMFGLGFDGVINLLSALPGFSGQTITSRGELTRLTAEPVSGSRFGIISGSRYALVETNAGGIATASLQPLLDQALNNSVSVDYIHGEDELFRLAAAADKPTVGILLPPVQKTGFFETVARYGPLPRKSFSMGEAEEKRFYIECREL